LSNLRIRTRPALTLAIVGILALGACTGGDGSSPDGDGGNGGNGGGLSGAVFVSGSSTVEPISRANAEKFSASEGQVDISVEGPGTSDGFALFCEGESDVSDASRQIDEEEIAICEENGIEYVELYVGIDGITVMTSPENDAVSCLSFVDLWALLGPDAEGFASWTDAADLADETAEASGGEFGESHAAEYPDTSLDVTAPGEESGTFDSFVEIALEDVGEAMGNEDVTTRPDYQSSADDNVIIQGIAGSEGSLGWVGFAYYEENTETVKALEVDGGSGCVAPSADAISSGEYPIARPLFVYVNTQAAEENEAVAAFIDFYMSDDGRASVTEVGYVDIPDEDWQASVDAWTNRTTGIRYGQ
jgi:phosphate transport system substrate-binding protein